MKKNSVEARGFRPGTLVTLRAYRKAKGDKRMKPSQIALIGKRAVVSEILLNKDGRPKMDKAGCIVVVVMPENCNSPEIWRLANLRKVR